jgi:hypothetical protein
MTMWQAEEEPSGSRRQIRQFAEKIAVRLQLDHIPGSERNRTEYRLDHTVAASYMHPEPPQKLALTAGFSKSIRRKSIRAQSDDDFRFPRQAMQLDF